MSPPGELNGFKAAARILHWLEAIGQLTLPIDLDLVRQLLPDTPFGRGAVIKEPAPLTWGGSEGALVRNPANEAEWGIFYHPAARPERRRFTIAHELGHFVLHRERYGEFNCSKEAIYSGLDSLVAIEREADEFAGNLLMPGNLLRQRLADRRVDLHLLSALAHEFGVSLEALCIRFVKYTAERAVLLYWDHGYLKYQWPSTAARRTRVRLRPSGEPAEPPPDTVAADATIAQEWAGVDLPAELLVRERSAGHQLARAEAQLPPGPSRAVAVAAGSGAAAGMAPRLGGRGNAATASSSSPATAGRDGADSRPGAAALRRACPPKHARPHDGGA